jgi:hypothetical protein
VVSDSAHPCSAVFYKGLFMTGSFNKSDVLRAFLKTENPTEIVLIDDREEMLADAVGECQAEGIPFLGILFKGIERISGNPDPKVAEFQQDYLLKHAEWLEDEDAHKQLILNEEKGTKSPAV